MAIVAVALEVPISRLFDYSADEPLATGQRVSVPFGRRQLVGVVVGHPARSDVPAGQLRPITAALADMPPLPAEWLSFTEFASEYYQQPRGELMMTALPPRLKRATPLRRKPVLAEASGQAWSFVCDRTPTPAQAGAIETMGAALDRNATFLLFGVTGSGKTEVYLHLIARVLEQGRQALVLVPEIHLTPQLQRHFAERFPGARVAVLHSSRAAVERVEGWIGAQSGSAQIVLGTRLAVFTPFARLGLVIVDEEHDASFKQQDGSRYSARDLAVYRAHAAGIPVVLGSATPALETWSNALKGRYNLVTLAERAVPGATMPRIEVVDMRKDAIEHGLTGRLLAAIDTRLARGEQALVFLNRRGYAPVLACGACGWVASCVRCSAHTAVHLKEQRLRCHHCGYESVIPRNCPDCGNVDLHPFGRGTERIEAALAARFPHARLARVDSDSMRRKGEWERTHAEIRDGAINLIVGTQMLAKGHDFPGLTLVGVVNADAALFATDYRAPERLFAQLLQVAGRAGRARLAGEVLVQTRYPEHPLYRAVIAGDFAGFAGSELEERKRAGFSPAVAEALLRAEASSRSAALGFLREAAAHAPDANGRVTLYDPVPMTLSRLAGWERAHLLVQARARGVLQRFLAEWRSRLEAQRTPRGVRWHFDVDPIEF
jgi:primosomal protein N' (replication factor Y)